LNFFDDISSLAYACDEISSLAYDCDDISSLALLGKVNSR